jgi:hypothetical protein
MKPAAVGQVIFLLFLVLNVSLTGFAADRVMVVAGGSYYVPRDQNFKELYGEAQFYPELKIGVRAFGKFSIWAAYGILSSTGETPVLHLESDVTQHFFSAGLGYRFPLAKKVALQVEPGLFYVRYKEKLLEEEMGDSTVGFRFSSGLLYYLSRHIFMEFSVGVLTASDTIDDISIKLGGVKAGLGVGLTL